MKVKIDSTKCIGCGTCTALAPDFFQLNEETGKAEVIKSPVSQEEVKEAKESCPVGAISWEDEE